MEKDSLYKLIDQIVNRIQNGEQVEENKVELKSEWYDFTENENRKKIESEFSKDLTVIANTLGPTGYLIIGINEKNGDIKNSPFSDSGLRDISDLHKIIVKCVDRQFDFEYTELNYEAGSQSAIIGIFTIPPSLEKPHFIKNYTTKKGNEIQNFIPVKKSTGIYPANRNDIELMYYDRKNIEPEFALEIKSYRPQLVINRSMNELKIDYQLCFENYGRRPITIVAVMMTIFNIPEHELPRTKYDLQLYKYHTNYSINSNQIDLPSRFIIVPSNSVKTIYCNFTSPIPASDVSTIVNYLRSSENKFSIIIEAIDLNGKKFQAELKEFTK